MTLRDLLDLVAGNLTRMRGRVAMTAVGVVIGTAALLVLVSLGAGLQRLSNEATSGTALTEIAFHPRIDYRIVEGAELDGLAQGAPPTHCGSVMDAMPVVDAPMLERIAALPGVAWVGVYESLLGTPDVEFGSLRGMSSVAGVEGTLLDDLGLSAARGTLTPRCGEAVVGANFAAGLYDPADRNPSGSSEAGHRGSAVEVGGAGRSGSPPDLLGRRLTLRLSTLNAEGQMVERVVRVRVVGVLEPRGWAFDDTLFMTERDVLELNNWMHAARAGRRRDPARQGYSVVIVRAADLESTPGVEDGLTDLGFPVYTERRQLEEWASFFATLQGFLGLVGAISLLVAAFGISNTMLMAVHERTREIGLLKAVGADNGAVLAIFLVESVAIGLLGGVGGVGVGLSVNAVLGLGGAVRIAGLPASSVYAPPWLPPSVLLFAGIVGVLSGTYPAYRASRLAPVAALHYE